MNLQTRWLNHLIRLCAAGQESHALHQAKHLAELYPQELESLPQLLVSAMQSQFSDASVTATKAPEKLTKQTQSKAVSRH